MAVYCIRAVNKQSAITGTLWYLSKGRLYALCVTVFIVSFCLVAHVLYMRYLNDSTLCLESYHDDEPINVDTLREKIKLPQTKRRLPQCLIIGVRKGGTRALLEFLNIHSMIQRSTDEIHFFDNERKYNMGLEWYRQQMPYSFADQITVEKSPAYFITEGAPERIRAMNESIRLLLIVREPVTRLISDYSQLAANKAKKDKFIRPFQDLVFREDGTVNTDYRAVRVSMYSLYIKMWLSVFQRDQILIINGDRMIRDPYPEIYKTEQFLGLEHRIGRENFFYNKTKGFYCVRNYTVDKCLNESKGRKHPPIDPEIISKLRQFYAPFNREFYNLVRQDFGWPED
ncbi:heparan sulfate glucosamine 3-O-sulfotransferase 1-like [Limulus polyphemus]|uniref:Heparan sulfate glucosamine 3-O-sulfotransferase 1-like n=1 Tax=Limulus polyphemus TaxID=6850 RepID=A0ABM1BBV5_LIMPO|nr:heparan sulfate glucosamine 3-O-sulfotransferase 1-like [Limulus polyphemus]